MNQEECEVVNNFPRHTVKVQHLFKKSTKKLEDPGHIPP